MLQINVLEAENLIAGDDNGFSDPYCLIKLGGHTKKTKVVKKTLNPKWNETFSFNLTQRDTFFDVDIWDWDAVGKDDFLGRVRVELSVVKESYDLLKFPLVSPGGAKDIERGSVLLRVRFVSAKQKQPKLQGNQLADVKSRLVAVLEAGYTELSLEGCGLSVWPAQLAERLATMTKLELSFNQFVQWPDLTPLVQLEEIFLNGNLLVKIEPNVSNLRNLRVLKVTGNQLVSLPPELGNLPALEVLGAANNQIMTLSPDIGNLKKLEELDLSGNPIQKLPKEIGGLRALGTLDMSGCSLTELPEEFTLMTSLIELNLGNNQLKKLPEGMGRMTRLTVLNLMFNQLTDLPISLGYCDGLAQLGSGITIAQNPIENEKMLAKYQMGTDHLFDYLEKRMLDYGELEMPEVYLKEDLEALQAKERNRKKQEENAKNLQLHFDEGFSNSNSPRFSVKNMQMQRQQSNPYAAGSPPVARASSFFSPPPPGMAGVRASSSFLNPGQPHPSVAYAQPPMLNAYGGRESPPVGGQNFNSPAPVPAQNFVAPVQNSPDINNELSTKMVLLKNWAISAIRGELQPKFSRINNFLQRTTSSSDVMPWAQFSKNMKPEMEKGKAFLPLIPMDPHRTPPAGADKLTILKVLVSTVVDDIYYMLEVFLKVLQETREAKQILGIVGFLKELKRELSYVEGTLNAS